MLQQTRVDTVTPYFERFMRRFPTPLALAEAEEGEVLAAWSGLGYYRRARMLHAGARFVAGREIPRSRAGLLELPGIGPYTAGAIASIAFGEPVGLVDGNVARVLARVFAMDDDMKKAGMRKAAALAERLVHAGDPGSWNQGLMELGATICTPLKPACDRCPVARSCRALAQGRVNELPMMSPKTRPRAQAVQALVAVRKGRVLLARRRSSGLFGGLWEPPAMDGTSASALAAHFPVEEMTKCGSVVHVLTHRRLTVDVHVATLMRDPPFRLPEPYEVAELVDERSLDTLAISKLARKILAAASRRAVK